MNDWFCLLLVHCPIFLAVAGSWLFGLVGCCCGASSCSICEDNFDRADNTDVNSGSSCGWDEDAGDWEVDDNSLRTTAGDAKIICQATHPDTIPSFYVEADLSGAAGDELKIGVGDHYVRLSIGDPGGCLSLHESDGTLLTKMRVSAAAATAHLLEVWYGVAPAADGGDSQLVARLGTDVLRYNVTLGGSEVWLGTGAITSFIRFDNFRFEKHYTEEDPDCNAPPAPTCEFFSDTFTRDDDDDLGCSYEEVTGDADISGNKAVLTAGSTKIACECKHPQESSALQVVAEMSGSANGDQLRVYTDTAGDTYGQLTVGTSATSKLFIGGVEAKSTSVTAAVSVDHQITVTHAEGRVSVQFGATCLWENEDQPAAPVRAGFGCGTKNGTITCSSFSVSRGYDSQNTDCPRACFFSCGGCPDDPPPPKFIVEFDDVSSDDNAAAAAAWNSTSFEMFPWEDSPSPTVCYYFDIPFGQVPCFNLAAVGLKRNLEIGITAGGISITVIAADIIVASWELTIPGDCADVDFADDDWTISERHDAGPGGETGYEGCFTCNLDFTNAKVRVYAAA